MKGIASLIIGGVFAFASVSAFAAETPTPTSMDSNWICTTNASTGTTDTETTADKQMSDTAKSASDAFTFASANCRDCTKITCEVKK